MTGGDGAIGMVAQSLGGGGGYADGAFGNAGGTGNGGADRIRPYRIGVDRGRRCTADLLQTRRGGGNGGAIDYTQDGNVVTAGDGSIGIIAQSLGGGGGFAADAFGNAGGTGNAGSIGFDSQWLDLHLRRRLAWRLDADNWRRR